MTDTAFIGCAKTETMLRDFNRLRLAFRSGDLVAADKAWADCERWVGCINPTAEESLRSRELDHQQAARVLLMVEHSEIIEDVAAKYQIHVSVLRAALHGIKETAA